MIAPALHRTAVSLSDGRELLYFDETPGLDRSTPDRRDLPPVEHHSQTRFDELSGEWITIAGHRQTRTYRPPVDACPLCPTSAANQSEIPCDSYDIVVFENRFPSFSGRSGGHGDALVPDPRPAPAPAENAAGPLEGFRSAPRPGLGRCEVVCFTSDHHATMSTLPASRVRSVVEVWTNRTRELSRIPGVAQVFCFENRGTEIGVTLDHPHGQIYAYPFVTPALARMREQLGAHREAHGRNLFGDLLDRELAGPRIVAQNDHWIAFVPFAARWPMEVHLYPRRQVPGLPELTDAERAGFVPVYREVLQRMEGLFDEPLPLITAWYQAALDDGPPGAAREDWWLHLRLFSIRRAPGKIKYLAGSESAMGAFINDTSPEDVAERLRRVSLAREGAAGYGYDA